MDGINLWPAFTDAKAVSGPRDRVILNIDVTNNVGAMGWAPFSAFPPCPPGANTSTPPRLPQGDVCYDVDGWSGYAGAVIKNATFGYYKLVYGEPGKPNGWCWPPNSTDAARLGLAPVADALDEAGDLARTWGGPASAPAPAEPVQGRPLSANAPCTVYDARGFVGIPLSTFTVSDVSACCMACSAVSGCDVWPAAPNVYVACALGSGA